MAKVDVEGGGLSHSAALQRMQLDDASKNWEMYSNWADSIRSFPKIIKQKVEKTHILYTQKANVHLSIFMR